MRRRPHAGLAIPIATTLLALSACAVDPPSAIVGVEVAGCGLTTDNGSGVIVEDGLVLTSAHVLRGVRTVDVVRGDAVFPAEVVGFDPDMDLALLSIERSGLERLPVASDDAERGDTASAWVMRPDGVARIDVTLRRRVTINTEDIYIEGETERPGWELDADIQPGDSGGAVIRDGRVIGVVWARSRRHPGRSYAIDPDRAGDLIRRQRAAGELGDEIDLSRCN